MKSPPFLLLLFSTFSFINIMVQNMKTLFLGLLLCLPTLTSSQTLPVPVLVSPAHQATNQPNTLTVKWRKVAGADQYMVEVIRSGQQIPLVSDTAYTDTARTVANLSDGLHYWRVRAKRLNPYQTSAWSAYRLFTVGSAGGLAAPVLASPSSGSAFQVTGTKLAWKAVSGATYYKLKVATDGAMTNVIFVDDNVVGTSRTLPNLSHNAQYFWQVRAANAATQSNPSATWNLTTMPSNSNAVATHPRLWFRQADVAKLRSWAVASNPVYVAMQTALATANTHYTTKFFPGGQPNGTWPDDGGVTWPTYCTEAYAQFFAFQSVIDPSAANRILYAQRARNLLMYIIDAALPGPANLPFRWPTFANKDRMNAWGETYPLIVDWIYDAKDANNQNILTAADKAKIRTVFMRWASEQLPAYNHPEPIGLVNDKQMLTTRKALNNYYSGHARSVAMLSLALDAADDPVLDPALPVSALGNSLRSYLFNATGAWLYQQYSQYELASIVAADYSIPATFPNLSSGSGGLSVESTLYGTSLGSVSGGLLALETAGWADPSIVGPQAKLIGSAYWTRFLDGMMHEAAPVAKVNAGAAYLGPIYPLACYGDAIRTWATPDLIKSIATVGLLAEIHGNQSQLDKARWYARNVIEGGAAKLGSRVSNIWGNNAASNSILYFLLLKPNGSSPNDPRPTIATTFYDPSRPRLLARTDWTANASWFDWQCPWNNVDHQLGDGNQFEFYRKGEWLIKERSGYDTDFIGCTSEFHNTLGLQNDVPGNLSWFEGGISERGGQWIVGQNAGDPTAITSIGANFIYATGNATNLYNRPNANPANAATDIEHASRSIVWLKPDHIVVYDRAKSKTANRFKRFFLQFTAPPTISGKNATVATPGGQKIHLSNLLPAASVLSTSVSESYAVAQLDPTHDQIKIEDPSNPQEVRFLNVIQGADGNTAQDPATMVQSTAGTAFEGAVVLNTAVLFARVWGVAFSSTTYSVPSTASLQIVTGLTPGAGYSVAQTSVGGNVQVVITPGSQLFADAGGVLLINTLQASSSSIENRSSFSSEEGLLQCSPNPFSTSTLIRYQLAAPALISLEVFDILGKKVRTLVGQEMQEAGPHEAVFSGDGFPAGTYVCRLSAGGKQRTMLFSLER